jgi:hypothetical protein
MFRSRAGIRRVESRRLKIKKGARYIVPLQHTAAALVVIPSGARNLLLQKVDKKKQIPRANPALGIDKSMCFSGAHWGD